MFLHSINLNPKNASENSMSMFVPVELVLVASLSLPACGSPNAVDQVKESTAKDEAEMSSRTAPEAAPATSVDELSTFAEYKAVAKALQPYIDSAKTGDGELNRTAFFDHAHIVGSVKGKFYNMDADAFKEAIVQGGASPEVQHHISWIDISGPAAAAKVEFINWGGTRFTDFFVLYKHDGEWKISGKVYDSHSNN